MGAGSSYEISEMPAHERPFELEEQHQTQVSNYHATLC